MAQVTYTVKKGDNLTKIANEYNTTVDKLVELNKIPNKNLIYVGQVLVISGDAVEDTTKTTSSKASNVTINLQADSDRTLIAKWSWSRENTDHYLVRVWWAPKGAPADGGILAVEDQQVSTAWRGYVYNAPSNAERVSFYVKPVAKTHKVGDKDVAYWTANWSSKVTYEFSEDAPPLKPDVPDVKIDGYQLTVSLDNLQDLNAESIQFHVYQDNGHLFAEETVKIVTYHVSHTFNIEPGHDYKVQCRSWRGDLHSDWTEYSANEGTKPAAPDGITVCRAKSATSVYLEWEAVDNAKTYDLQYTTKKEYFEGSDSTTTVNGIESTQYEKTGLESGQEYFFRVRAVNEKGESAWSGVKSIIIGKKPAAPTTWSSTTTAISGDPLILYWVHNAEDESKWTKAELELSVNGEVQTIEQTNPSTDEDEEDETSSYKIDTSIYTEGSKILWRVRTAGITGEYSDWSIQRTVDIYAPPTLSLDVTDVDGNRIETLTQFPAYVRGIAGPNTQKPIGYHLAVTADSAYETVDAIGNKKIVTKDGQVYSKYFDTSEDLLVELSANNIDLENNITYTVACTVTMNSGLNTTTTTKFAVAWTDLMYDPNAEITIDTDTYSALIRPYCDDGEGNLFEDVVLSVYRREFDGSFTEIATKLPNTMATFVTDPHPALDFARYRIVATTQSTGAVSYCDLPGYPVDGKAVIIQWDEQWTNFDVYDDSIIGEHQWAGSMLKLPYNIDVSDSNDADVALVEYIGRKRPVSYYGTQLGGSAMWSVEIAADDKETLYALRRLSVWMGDVYVREPSGTGYWANIAVSISQKHCEVTIPVTLSITRVEGGV